MARGRSALLMERTALRMRLHPRVRLSSSYAGARNHHVRVSASCPYDSPISSSFFLHLLLSSSLYLFLSSPHFTTLIRSSNSFSLSLLLTSHTHYTPLSSHSSHSSLFPPKLIVLIAPQFMFLVHHEYQYLEELCSILQMFH